jgi:hypothetical protein
MTSLLAIESCFRLEAHDPWRSELAGKLADIFIYGDTIRYTFPSPDDPSQLDRPWQAPPLVEELTSWDSKLLKPEGYSTARHREIADDVLKEFFHRFASWAKPNQTTLKKWLGLHNQPWLRNLHNSHVPNKYVYALNVLRRDPGLRKLSEELRIDENNICYGVDIMLKYPFFGELAKGDYYLNHPIRSTVEFPTLETKVGPVPRVCVSFAEDVKRIVKRLSKKKNKAEALVEYAALLYDLRRVCREEYKLHELSPKQVDKEVLREIAVKVKLSPKLRSEINEYGGLIGSIVKPSKLIVSVMNIIWKDGLPRSAVEWSKLHLTYTWDVEKQAEERE